MSLQRGHAKSSRLGWDGLVALLGVVLAVGLILGQHARSDRLLQDSDTRGILQGIASRNNPLSWFWTDWPLENHFYRPIPTLTFELDRAVYGSHAWGYGLTNALWIAGCVLLLAWVGSLALGSLRLGAVASLLFATWVLELPWVASVLGWLFAAGAAYVAYRQRRDWALWMGVAVLVMIELHPIEMMRRTTLDWLPGRTAIVMSFFALLAVGAALVMAQRPAWDSKRVVAAVIALVGGAFALASYEQAVMLPAIVALVLLDQSRPAFRFSLANLVAGMAVVVSYLALRSQILPVRVSRYQDQQLRFGPGVFDSFSWYALPVYPTIRSLRIYAEEKFLPFLVSATPWQSVAPWIGYGLGGAALIRWGRWRKPLIWMGASALAFLPMAFLQPFGHYHFLPMALRAIAVTAILDAALSQALEPGDATPQLLADE